METKTPQIKPKKAILHIVVPEDDALYGPLVRLADEQFEGRIPPAGRLLMREGKAAMDARARRTARK